MDDGLHLEAVADDGGIRQRLLDVLSVKRKADRSHTKGVVFSYCVFLIVFIRCIVKRTTTARGAAMYGLIGKMNAAPGKRDALCKLLLAGTQAMPGCLSYVIALDPTDPEGIWITEVWDNAESHKASLSLPAVREAITQAKPMIAGFGPRYETAPLGGFGL